MATEGTVQPQQLAIAILTCDRKPAYIHEMLDDLLSMRAHLSLMPTIHLMVGSHKTDYLDQYRDYPHMEIHPMSEEQSEIVQGWPVHRRFCVNYWRCLDVPIGDSIGVCVCEDDVQFRDGFFDKLCATIEDVEHCHGHTRYVLAGYAPYFFENNPSLYRGKLFCRYVAQEFYGTQCVFYPRSVVKEVADRMRTHGVDVHGPPGDMIVKQWCIENNNLYACTRSLVQHVGVDSTGLGCFHQSPTFDLEFERLRQW